jgi:hypothetical protein
VTEQDKKAKNKWGGWASNKLKYTNLIYSS